MRPGDRPAAAEDVELAVGHLGAVAQQHRHVHAAEPTGRGRGSAARGSLSVLARDRRARPRRGDGGGRRSHAASSRPRRRGSSSSAASTRTRRSPTSSPTPPPATAVARTPRCATAAHGDARGAPSPARSSPTSSADVAARGRSGERRCSASSAELARARGAGSSRACRDPGVRRVARRAPRRPRTSTRTSRWWPTTFHRFAAEQVRPHAEHVHRTNGDIPEALIAGLAELGGLGLSVPEAYGGFATRRRARLPRHGGRDRGAHLGVARASAARSSPAPRS